MKNMKKIFALLLTVVMVMGLSVTAFAQDVTVNTGENDGGSITVENATIGQTYTIYKVFDATYSGTGDDAKVSYTFTKTDSNTELYNALTDTDSPFTLTPSAKDSSVYVVTLKTTTTPTYAEVAANDYDANTTYYTYDSANETYTVYTGTEYPSDGTVLYVITGSTTENTYSDSEIVAFVEGLVSKLTELKSVEATDTTLKFTNLDYGYYYITSTLGTLVTIDSALPDATVQDKNTAPTDVKTVEEDSDNTYGTSNTADVGDVVNFKSTITAYKGAENYVLHDTMTAGLTFDSTSVVVTVGTTTLTAGNQYTLVTTDLTDDCTFEVKFAQTYLDTITETTTIVVSYSATVNEKAVIGTTGNGNTSKLSYGDTTDPTYTTDSTTTTYVFDFDIHKYADDDTTGYLADADFVLYKTDAAGTKSYYQASVYAYTYTDNGDTVTVYSKDGTNYYTDIECKTTAGDLSAYDLKKGELADVAWVSSIDDATHFVTDSDGVITISGLDAGTYYLLETAAPNGYNLLNDPVTVAIDANGNVTVGTDTTAVDEVLVQNQSGTELPSTGGIGTTIFYVVGTILVLGAAILLITKKRMSGTQE